MVLFAGPVFPEWFDDVFFAIVFAPIPLAIAIVVDLLLLRRRLHVGTRVLVATAIVAVVMPLGFAGRELRQEMRFERQANDVASRFTFTAYQPDTLPPPFVAQGVNADDQFGGPALVSDYGALGRAYQQPVAPHSLESGRCSVTGLAGPGGPTFDGPCRRLRSPKGIPVFASVSSSIYYNAFAVLDETMVHLRVGHEVSDRALLAYFDSLQPVARDAIEFEQAA